MPHSNGQNNSGTEDPFTKPVRYVKGVGPKRGKKFRQLGIESVEDLLFHLPHRYEVREPIQSISKVRPGKEQIIQGTIHNIRKRTAQSGTEMVEAEISDETGRLAVTWFNMPYLTKTFDEGDHVQLAGEVQIRDRIRMTHPEFDLMNDADAPSLSRVEPVYPVTEGIGQPLMKKIMKAVYEEVKPELTTLIPESVRENRDLQPFPEAIKSTHFPEEEQSARNGKKTLRYLQALCFFLNIEQYRSTIQREAVTGSLSVSDVLDRRIRARFPFSLTDAQNRVVQELRSDLERGEAMYRLLQGDVGSGKTVVALYAMLVCIAHEYQTSLMAPTSVLARQHFQTLDEYLHDSEVQYALLTGDVRGKKREQILRRLQSGELDLIVGTHALIEEEVSFDNLGLAVIDEQQRFGVRHRSQLLEKGERPHVLVTTATPIPRTLALTVYGDLKLSILDEMPPGRKPVITAWRKRERLPKICSFIRERVHQGEQAFFVYPLIEESEELPLTSATEMHEALSTGPFSDLSVELLHGQMNENKKNRIMETFRQNDIQILVSTLVIEVGVDIPNATIMVIDHAERYGLSQLHQLRGRIGRGEKQSYCVLLSDREEGKARERLNIFTSTSDGFKIAEEDLRLRGPGALLGTRQHGPSGNEVLKLQSHPKLLQNARKDARTIHEAHPDLESFPELQSAVARRREDTLKLLRSG